MHGIIAMEACEAVFRLLDEGETGVDAGANVGTVCSSMVHRVGRSGHVLAFEMMPQTFAMLNENVEAWKSRCPQVEAFHCALSDSETTINIGLSPDFLVNTGVAYATHGDVHPGHQVLSAQAKRLDSFLSAEQSIHLLKLDVERHEYAVLKGAEELLKSGRIRDIVLEDATHEDSTVKQLLRSNGYSFFSMQAGLFGVSLIPFQPSASHSDTNADDYSDFLATRNPERALARWAKRGYRCLSA